MIIKIHFPEEVFVGISQNDCFSPSDVSREQTDLLKLLELRMQVLLCSNEEKV